MHELADDIDATVVITTKDRKQDLRRAVQSAVHQTADPEVLVIDDGSSDGTSRMIREEFPGVRLHREETSAGLIVRRNQGARMANGSIIFSIDDDAEFSTPHVIEQTLAEFDKPRVGAVAIPYVDVHRDRGVQQRAPSDPGIHCTSAFRGTAHALRRDLFLQLGGYREHLVHQGEEMDYCVRMLDAGYVVRLGRSDIIKHYESPKRSFDRMDFYGRRNDVLFGWHNVPSVLLPFYFSLSVVNTVRTAVRLGRVQNTVAGMVAGFRDCIRHSSARQPVKLDTYHLFRKLQRDGPRKLSLIKEALLNEPTRPMTTSSS
jgi:glycosyltransferase involved in cell wall biosynthesis